MGFSRQESWSGVPSFSWEGGGSSICYFYLNGLPTSHTNPIWTSTNFYLLQLSLFCEWIHHLTRCLSQKPVRVLFLFFFLILPTSSLVLPIHLHALVIPLHFSRIWALLQPRIQSHPPEPLKESIISLPLHLHPLLPHLLSLHSVPTPTKSFSSLPPEQCFKSDHATLTLKMPQELFCLPET